MHELDSVVLAVDLPEHGLKHGDLGTIMLVHPEGKGYEVEFVALDGESLAVVSLRAAQVRPARQREIAHVRPLSRALVPQPARAFGMISAKLG